MNPAVSGKPVRFQTTSKNLNIADTERVGITQRWKMKDELEKVLSLLEAAQAEMMEFYKMVELHEPLRVNCIEAVFGYNSRAIDMVELIIDEILEGEC